MNTPMFKLNYQDFVRGAVTAVFAAVIITVYGYVSRGDFNVFTADWGSILNGTVNAAVAAFIGYIGKNFMTADNGKVFGRL